MHEVQNKGISQEIKEGLLEAKQMFMSVQTRYCSLGPIETFRDSPPRKGNSSKTEEKKKPHQKQGSLFRQFFF